MVQKISLFEFFKIAVYGFVIQRTPFGFQIIGYGFCGECISDIAESIFHHTFKLVNLTNLISFNNIRENS